jgi:hypothetical protein
MGEDVKETRRNKTLWPPEGRASLSRTGKNGLGGGMRRGVTGLRARARALARAAFACGSFFVARRVLTCAWRVLAARRVGKESACACRRLLGL